MGDYVTIGFHLKTIEGAQPPMNDIIALLSCLGLYFDKTILRQLSHIIAAMLSMTGRITMLGISRWTDEGGSYRTV